MRFFTCDGLFPICDLYQHAISGERPANACESCQLSAGLIFKEYGLVNSKLGKYKKSGGKDLLDISEKIQKLSSAELLNFEAEGFPIYSWIISSVLTHHRANAVNFGNEAHIDSIKKYLIGGWLAARLIERMLDDVQPASMVVFNGRQSYTKIAFELAQRRGIRTICHERAPLEERFSLWENDTCESLVNYSEAWQKWKDFPLASAEVLEVRKMIHGMSEGAGMNWRSFVARTKSNSLSQFLEIHKGKKIWTLFPSSTDEAAANKNYWKAFKSQREWISATIDFVSRQTNLVLIIRAHPNMGSATSRGTNQEEVEFFKNLENNLPNNVLLIQPNEAINSYEILNHTDLGLVFLTTLSIEMACRGIPVIAAGNPGWSNCLMVSSVENREHYLNQLASFYEKMPSFKELVDLVKGAYRIAHASYFKSSFKYPFFKQLNFFNYSIDAKSAENFQPGKYLELDLVVDVVLGNSSVVPDVGRVPSLEDFEDEEVAIKKALAFFRHPDFLSNAPQLSIILQSRIQIEELIASAPKDEFQNSNLLEFVLCNFEETHFEQNTADLAKVFKKCRTIKVQTHSAIPAQIANEAIRKSSGQFVMFPDAFASLHLELLEKFLRFPKQEEDTIFFGNLIRKTPAEHIFVKPPPNITIQILARYNPLPSCSIFSRKIWDTLRGFRAHVDEAFYWDFWLAAAIAGKKFQYFEAIAEFVSNGSHFNSDPHPHLVLNNCAAFSYQEIQKARNSLGLGNLPPSLAQVFGNHLDPKLANLKRIKESGQKLSWQTEELVAVVSPLLKMRCYELSMFVLEEILAREPGNSSALKVYRDVLPHCGRKEEVPFVQKQIADGATLPMPEVQVHLESLKTEEVDLETQEKSGDFFSAEEVVDMKLLVEAFKQNPHGTETGDALRNLRLGMAEHLLGADLEALKALFSKDYGEIFRSIIESGLINSERLPEEENVALAVRSYFATLGEKLPDVRFLLVGMLFFNKLNNLSWPHAKLVPEWIRSKYDKFFNVDGFQLHQNADLAKEVLGKEKNFLCQSESDTLVSVQKMGETATNWDPSISRILFLTGSPCQYMAPPEFGAFQINAGPDWENEKDALGRWKSLKTPVGRYAVDSLLRQLPPDEQPDILVCLVDASRRSMPAGLSAFRGPKVLLVADTHHMQSPLQSMMAYAASEPFDRMAFLYDRHHIPLFQAAGFKNLFWLPGFTFPHDDAALEKVSKLGRQNIVGFVGQAGNFHPRRVRLLEALQAGQIPFLQKAVSQSESLKFYAAAAIGFNASLNGDLNLRFFEVLSSGAAVLTDSLGLDSGLELLADAGCRFETYSSAEELVEKAKNLLGNPTHAAEIGKAGRSWFLEHLRREKRSEIFHRVAFDGFEPQMFKIPSKPSFKVSFSENQLPRVLEVYDFVQEMHRVQEKTTILREVFEGDLDFFKSLPRIEIDEAGAGKLGDLLVTTVAGGEACRLTETKHLWLIDADNDDPSWLYSQGYSRLLSKAAFFERKFRPLGNGAASIEVALGAFAEGRLSDAEDICREILGKDERCAGAWHLMGQMAALQGDMETASEFASVACELDPQNAEFVRELADVFLRKKELESAEQQVRRALELSPDSPEGLVLLGRIMAEKEDKTASLEAFQDALRLRKDYAEGFSHYATALQKFGRGKDAISQIRKACVLEPDSVELQTNLAILLEQNARYVDALAAYGKAARLNPNVGFVWFRQGKLLNGLKRYAESIPVLAKAISLPGQLGDYHYEYGLALHMSKRFQEALVHYEKALSMGYNTAALQCNRGVIYKDLRKGGDAIMAFHAAVKMDPSNVSYLNNLGAAALELGLNTEALECFEQAVEKNPKLPTARNNIGNLLKDRARGMDALPQYRKSMELNPDDRDAPSNYLLCHMYIPDIDPKLVFEEHKKWGISTTKKFPPAFKSKPREAGAKIRVGFLSADLCHHPVAHFIEPIFRGYDRERFEFVAYGDQRKSDEFSARFAKQVDLWRETSSYDDRALAKLIHDDRVDILFELAGHTAYNRLGVFALKPAPVQVSYLGYPGTTGLPTIDFRITDALTDPQGTTEHLHTEKLIRVPECAWCFEPDASAPEIEPLPALKNGYVTFGCFNNMAKLNPSLFETWAEILLRVPGSHLRLKARTLTDDGVRKELKSYFTERGIEDDRLDFFGHTRKIIEHLGHYHSVDIALDSFPYHGTTTTCEAMWMGCPVVTRAGKTHVSRVGVSLLSAVGLQEFITDTREAYIEKAVALAAQTDRLQELRSGMRERLRQSVLMDEKRFVQGFEKALMEMATLAGLMRP